MLGLSLATTLGNPILNAGGGYNPVTALGSSLLAWWTADRADLITLSGSAMTNWKDVKHGYDFLQGVSAARPIYSATSWANAVPGATIDGIDDEMTCTDAALLAALPSGAAPGEMWALVDQTTDPSDTFQRWFLSFGTTATLARRIGREVVTGQNRAVSLIGTGGANFQPQVSGDFTGRHVIRSKVEATQGTTSLDGTAGTPAAGTPATDITRVRFGSNSNGTAGAFGKGVVRDLMLTAPLISDQSAPLTAWLNSRRIP